MSAFVCILDRSGAPLDRHHLLRLAAPLDIDGRELAAFCEGPVGIAIRRPEGAAADPRHGPLVDPASGRVAAVAGRFGLIDAAAAGEAPAGVGSSDAAALALAAGPHGVEGKQGVDGLLARVAGAFVLISADPRQGALSVASDHLGSCKLYYFLDHRWMIAASEPTALLRHAAVSDELDERSAARFLGFRFAAGGRSFFRHVRELPPAHRLRVDATAVYSEPYWRLRPRRVARGQSPDAVGGELLARLGHSIALELAGVEPRQVALSLSGGLDSGALAALAPRGVQAFSWTFEETPECDERGRVAAVADHLGLPVHQVRGDGLHPLCEGFAERFAHAGSPHLNAFAALKARLYDAARAAGCTRVMVGDGGDTLYAAQEYWLRDVLAGGRPGALASLAATLRAARRGNPFARLALLRVLPVRGLRSALGPGPRWLTAAGRSLLPPAAPSPIVPRSWRRRRAELIAGARHTEIESEEQRLFDRCGVERSNPFWSWPLLEWAVGLPADWSHRDGRGKVLSRQALAGLLPARVLEGGRSGLLGSFFLRGIERERRWIEDRVFRHPRSDWQRYVDRGFLEPFLAATGSIRFEHTILWRVIGYELWQRRLIGRS
jgi:asparagine synthase (glutamine-hydrolysing)